MNDRLVTEIRRAMAELADATPPTPPLDDLLAARSAPPSPRRPRPFTIAAVAVSLTVAIAGLVFLRSRVDHESRTDEGPPTTVASVNTTTATTATAPTTVTESTAPPPTSSVTTAPSSATTVPSSTDGPPDSALAVGFMPMSITWISLQTGWLLGQAPCADAAAKCLSLARTRDGGRTWHGVPVPPIASEAVDELRLAGGIRFANGHDGWVFGATMWATHDGGSTWQQVQGMADITSLDAASGRAYAIASGGSDTAKVYTALSGSDTWSVVDPTPVLSYDLALRGSTGYAVGTDGRVRGLSPTGLTTLGQPCADGGGLLAVGDSATVVSLCGEEGGGAMGSSPKHIRVSTDGGQTFNPAGDAPIGGTGPSLAAASATTYVVGAVSGATFIYRSTDRAVTWQTVFEDEPAFRLADLGFTDATHGVAIMQSEPTSVLLTTSDGGATWTKAAIHD